ncbi:biotin/lipoyl-binding protein [bacterium]|nr:biotin/lipoyl-binding protein [candidate division CSSED10-310 bacterium]
MKLKITVHGVAYEVEVEVLDAGEEFHKGPLPKVPVQPQMHVQSSATPLKPQISNIKSSPPTVDIAPGGAVTSPIAGTVLEIKCKVDDTVQKDQILLIIEAMKMETSIAAPASGKIKSIEVAVGDAVREGQILVNLA